MKSVQQILDNGYPFRTSDYISRGWDLFKQNMGNFLLFTVVYMAIAIGLGIIPIIGQIASLVLSPAIAIGPFIVAHKIARGEATQFGDFFKGLDKLGNLFMTNLIMIAVLILVCIPGMLLAFSQLYSVLDTGGLNPTTFLYLFLAFIPAAYLGVSYSLANQFVWFHNLSGWAALEASRKVVSKNWWSFFGFYLLCGLIALGGMVVVFVGLLVAIPWIICSMYAAFADITELENDGAAPGSDIVDHFVTD